MRDYIKVWGELGLTFDGLYCGFLGNEEQIDIVREFVEMFRPPLFLLDPVMGDHGRAYSSITETHVQKMKELLPLADIITPNITEVLPADRDSLEGWGMDAAGAVRIM
ncbi:MAG: bifunctional hydroxymethylpyrimidine kinase/phosphomethylpyrimidine kinase [Waltera sp.]